MTTRDTLLPCMQRTRPELPSFPRTPSISPAAPRVLADFSHSVMDAVIYRQYSGESELPHIMALVQHELSEPYVIYTYRYFLQQW